MKRIDATTKRGQAALKQLDRRAEPDASVSETVGVILDAVRERGDDAVVEFTRRFDRAELESGSLEIPPAEAAAAWAALDARTRRALQAAHRNITTFARRSLRYATQNWTAPSKAMAIARLRQLLRDGDLWILDDGSDEVERMRRELLNLQEKLLPSGVASYAGRRSGHDDFAALVLNAMMADTTGALEGSPIEEDQRKWTFDEELEDEED